MAKITYHYGPKIFDNKAQLCDHIGWDNLDQADVTKCRIKVDSDLGGYRFRRQRGMDLQSHAIKRFKQLREKYDYLRFWYSGGKDSQSVLEWAREADIVFDEIVVMEHNEKIFFRNEEIKSLKIPKDRYKKLTWIDLDGEVMNHCFRNPDWWRHSLVFSIFAVIELEVFDRYARPHIKKLDMPDNLCDIVGGITPNIYNDNGWKFYLNEYGCANINYPHCENFLISKSYPEIYEAYVNNICDSLEDQNLVLNKKDMEKFLGQYNDPLRFLRDSIPWFSDLKLQAQWGKMATQDLMKEFELEPWGRFAWTYKFYLATKNSYGTDREYWINYCNSDWNKINRMYDFGTVVTKTFELN